MHVLPVLESNLPDTTGNDHVVAIWKEIDEAEGFEAEVLLVAYGLCLHASLDGLE